MTAPLAVPATSSTTSKGVWARTRGSLGTWLHYGVLLLFLFLTFFIFALMISLSLRRSIMIYLDFWAWPWPVYWDNYQAAMTDLIPSALRKFATKGKRPSAPPMPRLCPA